MRSLVIAVVCLSVCVLGRRYHHIDYDEEKMMADDWKPGDDPVLINFNTAAGDKINDLINYNVETALQYIAIATFFRRHDVDIIGMSLMYNALARKKINQAKDIMMYLVKRGAPLTFSDIPKPTETQWPTPAEALTLSLKRERKGAEKSNAIAKLALRSNDAHLLAFVEQNLVNSHIDNVFAFAALINKLQKAKGAGIPLLGLTAINAQMVKKYRDFVDCQSDTEKYRWNY